jgi:hypothetical protein
MKLAFRSHYESEYLNCKDIFLTCLEYLADFIKYLLENYQWTLVLYVRFKCS